MAEELILAQEPIKVYENTYIVGPLDDERCARSNPRAGPFVGSFPDRRIHLLPDFCRARPSG